MGYHVFYLVYLAFYRLHCFDSYFIFSVSAFIAANVFNNTHTTQPFYGSVEFVRENPGEPVPEETFTHYSHLNVFNKTRKN